MQALRPAGATEILIVALGSGQFSGDETNMITGRRAMGRLRASEPGEVIHLDREQLLVLIQTDAELSEILMRAFMLRRVELIAHELSDVVVIGSTHCAGTLNFYGMVEPGLGKGRAFITGYTGGRSAFSAATLTDLQNRSSYKWDYRQNIARKSAADWLPGDEVVALPARHHYPAKPK